MFDLRYTLTPHSLLNPQSSLTLLTVRCPLQLKELKISMESTEQLLSVAEEKEAMMSAEM